MSSDQALTIARNPKEIRAVIRNLQARGETVALVPTMGALHDGHLSLITEAKKRADHVVASIFVNPTQFAAHEDLDSYPRAETADLEKLESVGCKSAYCPGVEDMYPKGDKTRVTVEDISFILEGEFRPHFFVGVATIVSRLFIHVMPDIAVFGEKDYQQLLIIQRMTTDLGLPIEVVGAPTIREPDGLAMSSRNAYLSKKERKGSVAMPTALSKAAAAISSGVSIAAALADAYKALDDAGLGPIDYIAVRDADTLADLGDGPLEKGVNARILAAAWLGKTRLIDNMPLQRL